MSEQIRRRSTKFLQQPLLTRAFHGKPDWYPDLKSDDGFCLIIALNRVDIRHATSEYRGFDIPLVHALLSIPVCKLMCISEFSHEENESFRKWVADHTFAEVEIVPAGMGTRGVDTAFERILIGLDPEHLHRHICYSRPYADQLSMLSFSRVLIRGPVIRCLVDGTGGEVLSSYFSLVNTFGLLIPRAHIVKTKAGQHVRFSGFVTVFFFDDRWFDVWRKLDSSRTRSFLFHSDCRDALEIALSLCAAHNPSLYASFAYSYYPDDSCSIITLNYGPERDIPRAFPDAERQGFIRINPITNKRPSREIFKQNAAAKYVVAQKLKDASCEYAFVDRSQVDIDKVPETSCLKENYLITRLSGHASSRAAAKAAALSCLYDAFAARHVVPYQTLYSCDELNEFLKKSERGAESAKGAADSLATLASKRIAESSGTVFGHELVAMAIDAIGGKFPPGFDLHACIDAVICRIVLNALAQCQQDKEAAAELLGYPRGQSLNHYIRKRHLYGM